MGLYRGYTRATTSVEGVRYSSRMVAAALAYVGTLWVTLVHHLSAGIGLQPTAVVEALRDGTVMVPLLMLVLAATDRLGGMAGAAARASASAAVLGLLIPVRALLGSRQPAEQPLTLEYLFAATMALAVCLPICLLAALRRRGDLPTWREVLRATTSRRVLALTAFLAYAAGGALHVVHIDEHERHAIDPALHWLRDSTLSLPLALVAVVVSLWTARQVSVWMRDQGSRPAGGPLAQSVGSLAGAATFGALSIPGNAVHGWLFVATSEHAHGAGHHGSQGSGVGHLLADAAVATLAAGVTLLLAVVAVAVVAQCREESATQVRRTGRGKRLAVLATTAGLLGTPLALPVALAPAASAATTSSPDATGCSAATAARRYDVAAISVPIPYNRFGDLDPNGMVYVFEQDKAAVDNWYRPLAQDAADDPAENRRLRPRPLVIRANEGECVEVTFTNRLDAKALENGAVTEPRASMNVTGAAFSASSDGANVGYNEDSTVGRGETIKYYWRAPKQEGLHLFRDLAMSAGSEADGGSVAHGLWGGFAVEPAGSQWFDTHSGLPLYPVSSVSEMSGELYLDANVKLPSGDFFRETVQISQDEIPNVGFGFNYGADAQKNRDEKRCPDCIGEETSLSSWTYGEPAAVKLASGLPGADGWAVGEDQDPEDCQADNGVSRPAMMMPAGVPGGCWTSNVTHAYKGDPTKIRFAHAGVKETHVFHMHAHQWLSEPMDVGAAGSNPTKPSDVNRPQSTTIDSQTYGPGDAFTADLMWGAGSKPGTIGDSIFHCHLYPHFADGFWSLFRVHDVFENGSLETPDGVRTRLLTVLPDRKAAGQTPGVYDAQTNPGFPRFVPGKFGWRAPQAPGSISDPEGNKAIRMVAGQGLSPELMNQIQDIAAAAESGPFTLTYRGNTTAALGPESSAQDIEAALEALDGVADVTVEARGDIGRSWRVRFADPVTNVRALSTDNAAVKISTVEGEWHKMLAAERSAQDRAFAGTGTGPKPGAPFADPCPQGAREVTYNVSVIQRDLVYNSDGWHDTQGRLLVLTKDVPGIMAGTKKPEPLFFRANAGDCIDFNLTNMLPNWYGNDAFQVLQQTNMFGQHIHLVKFDVLASDGSSNGWNYQQAAFSERQADFDQGILDGTEKCTTDEAKGACRLALPAEADYDPSAQRIFQGQTIHERWYADYELRTVFTHDHHFPAVDQGRGLFGGLIVEPEGMDFRNSRTGTYHQPINDASHGPVCGTSCEGDAAGTTFDVIGPGAKDDFREFGLAFQDFVPLTRAGGDPKNPDDVLNPPAQPEHFADDDPGVMGINYRNEPFLIRDTVNGRRTDPAHVFSSTLHGDPATPLLQAYAGDPVRVRLVAGSQEEQHVFGLHGMRWRDEPDDPDSPFTAAKALGVSEAFNFEVPEMDCAENTDCRGDYLYSSTATDDLYLGMWGLMRVYGKGVQTLKPLPDNIPQAVNGNTSFSVTGEAPPLANKPGKSCPVGAPVRTFDVAATDAKITYNKQGDHDPYGLVYVAAEPGETVADAVARVRKDPEPMSLRANEGDCIEVRLHNRIDPKGAFATKHAPLGAADGDPSLPLEPPTGTPAGLRVSLHPQLLKFDVRGSDGATVGFNKDQTVAPGQDILYRWYADDVAPGELGAINLTDYGDVRGHRHHGLFASLTVEPKGATYHDPVTGERLTSGASADIRVPGRPDFREFTSFYQDGLNLRDDAGEPVPDGFDHLPVPGEAPDAGGLDSEDQGEKGFNYASTPFRHRLGMVPMAADADNPLTGRALADVFSSTVHGDPDTPVFRSYAGDPVRMRVLQGGDKPRQHNFGVHGHSWLVQPDDPGSTRVGVQGGLSVDRAVNIELDSTGNGNRGDYLYGDSVGFHHLSGGTWGILRSYAKPAGSGLFQPSALGTGTGPDADNPNRDGYSPILPLERTSVTVSVFDDSNADANRGASERRGPDTDVTLRSADGTTSVTRKVGADGTVTFSVGRGAYDVTTNVPADWKRTTAATTRVDLTAENAAEQVAVGMVQLADIGVTVFDDSDGDGTRATGEGPLAGVPVKLTKGQESYTATTGTDGSATFDGLVPGDWALSSPGQPGSLATRALPATVSVVENQTRAGSEDTMLGFAMPAGLSVKLFNDANEDGIQQAGETSRVGWKVSAQGGPQERQVTVTATTDANGVATFEDPAPEVQGLTPGSYTITPELPTDWSVSSGRAMTTKDGSTAATAGFDCANGACRTVLVEKTAQVATVAVHNPYSTVIAAPFNDLNNDGVKQEKESRLAGWAVTAISATGERQVLDTGNGGRAMFYPMTPGTYTLEMLSPEPSSDPNVLDWTATNRAGCVTYGTSQKLCQVKVDVIAGEAVTGAFGFVQLGTVGVTTYHDYDKDGVWDDNEPAQANRTVRLYDATGKTVLQTKVTDVYGRVAFKTAAGVKYKVSAVLPTGWKQTSPLTSTGTPITSVAVTGPVGTQSTDLQFGQYNTADSVAPPVPTSSVAAGTYDAVQKVTLRSETGATIRYTLSGAVPTATTGHVYTGPITISNSHLLRAVAVDAAGNVSGELMSGELVDGVLVPGLQIDVDLGTKALQTPTKWTVMTGGTPTPATGMTLAGSLQQDDGLKVVLPSTYVTKSKSYLVDGYASMQLPTAQRNVVGLGVELDGRATLTGSTRTLMLYDFKAAAWVTLFDRESQPITDMRSVMDASGDPARFVSGTGEVRVRMQAARTSGAFDMRLDQALLRIQYR